MSTSEPRLCFVSCRVRLAFWEWGLPESDHVIVCVHGLTRQGRDFDALARALLAQRPHLRIVCPDIIGRGHSDWLPSEQALTGYAVPQYTLDMLVLLRDLHARAPIRTLDWVGTSMGGLIGLGVCAYALAASAAPAAATAGAASAPSAWPLPCGVRSLVLNDIGPRLEWPALERIATYVGKAGEFDSIADGAAALWRVASSFGPHTDEEWLALSRPMLRPVGGASAAADGSKVGADSVAPATKYRVHYDPAIAAPFANASEAATLAGETMLWTLYDRLTSVRALLVRGADSDLLSAATADEMARRGPCARVVAFAGVGHAPTLVHADQSDHVVGFLLDGDAADAATSAAAV